MNVRIIAYGKVNETAPVEAFVVKAVEANAGTGAAYEAEECGKA